MVFCTLCGSVGGGIKELGGGAIGCCMIIKDEILRMENVEHNTTIGCNVMNEDGIEHFSIFMC